MTTATLTAALNQQFSDVRSRLIASTVQAVVAAPLVGTAEQEVERMAPTDVAALAEAARRSAAAPRT